MRTIAYTSNSMRHHSRTANVGAFARHLWLAYVAAVRRRATERALAGLSDQTLRDIGLHRSEISSVARQVTDDRYPRRW